MNDIQGSKWRKWDLHVHSPASYGGDYDEFIKNLNNSEAEVVGINDYATIAGFEEVMKRKDDLQKIVFPVVEFRMNNIVLDKDDPRSVNGPRINFHLIFDNKPELLSKIKNCLNSLDCFQEGGKKVKLGDITDTEELKKLSFDFFKVIETLKSHDDLKDSFLVWIPYDEYGGIDNIDPENDSYFKMGLINKCDIIGSSNPKQINFFLWKHDKHNSQKIKAWLNERRLPSIKGSDAHKSNYPFGKLMDKESNPIDKYCWIKADPTFRGLQHVTLEPEGRVFIGETPEILTRVENNKTKYIKSLKIKKKDSYKNGNGVWFEDIEIEFNHELIAIIGNKGSGKSAVSDILGLMGDTKNAGKNNENFTFLNSDKFLKRGYGENFKATLEWEFGDPNEKFLHDAIEPSATETIKYIPQHYFEALCNHDEDKFEEELRSVVFKHLKPEDRLGSDTFSELIELKTKTINSQIQDIKGKISILNTEIIVLEEKKDPQYLIELQNKLKVKEEELESHNKIEPKKVADPSKDESLSEQQKGFLESLNKLNNEVEELDQKITEKESQANKLKIEMLEIETLTTELNDLEASIKDFREVNKQRYSKYGFDVDKEITLTVNKKTLTTTLQTKSVAFNTITLETISEEDIETLEGFSDEELVEIRKNSLHITRESKKVAISEINKKLDAPLKVYKKYLDDYRTWKTQKDKIVGNKETIETLEYLKEQIRYVNEDLELALTTKRDARITYTLDIFVKKSEIKGVYDKIKKPIDDLITTKQNLLKDEEKEYQIAVDTSFKFEDFAEDFLSLIDKGEKGSFRGVVEGANVLNEIIKEKDLNNKDNIKLILETILKHLEEDQRNEVSKDDKARVIKKQIAGGKVKELYNYLFSLDYLKENYELRLDGKILNELSPGEKGSLLLVFYLMLDKDDIPLIIDQPEDNLDNQSVSKILVPFIKEARRRRQIIMVTHNPNLAVVADAEQVIHVSIDKKNQHKVTITTGAIENPIMNKLIVDVLEGTMPAFDNRKLKYITNSHKF